MLDELQFRCAQRAMKADDEKIMQQVKGLVNKEPKVREQLKRAKELAYKVDEFERADPFGYLEKARDSLALAYSFLTSAEQIELNSLRLCLETRKHANA